MNHVGPDATSGRASAARLICLQDMKTAGLCPAGPVGAPPPPHPPRHITPLAPAEGSTSRGSALARPPRVTVDARARYGPGHRLSVSRLSQPRRPPRVGTSLSRVATPASSHVARLAGSSRSRARLVAARLHRPPVGARSAPASLPASGAARVRRATDRRGHTHPGGAAVASRHSRRPHRAVRTAHPPSGRTFARPARGALRLHGSRSSHQPPRASEGPHAALAYSPHPAPRSPDARAGPRHSRRGPRPLSPSLDYTTRATQEPQTAPQRQHPPLRGLWSQRDVID